MTIKPTNSTSARICKWIGLPESEWNEIVVMRLRFPRKYNNNDAVPSSHIPLCHNQSSTLSVKVCCVKSLALSTRNTKALSTFGTKTLYCVNEKKVKAIRKTIITI